MFALLEHDLTPGGGRGGELREIHWDLLIEADGLEGVPTWRLVSNPLTGQSDIPAQRIKDHRRLYLDYEGAVSGGRGSVRRLDHGPAKLLQLYGDEVIAELSGDRLRGRLTIVRAAGGGPVLNCIADIP